MADREYVIPETVRLAVRVSAPGTRKPVDPNSVTVTTFRREGVDVVLAEGEYTRDAEGDYSLSIPTADLDPGVYDVVTTIEDGPLKVVRVPDRFVLLDSA